MKKQNEEKQKAIIDWLYLCRDPRKYVEYAPTLRINCGNLLVSENNNEDGIKK